MIKHFLQLEWKQYFRSSYWEKGLALKIIMGFFALYLLGSFLLIGIGGFYIIEDQFPNTDPLQLVNSYLLYAIFADLIFRYMMQKLPIMNIKPLLILPIKKSNLVHFVLGKSVVSIFNIMPLFFYVPFAIVLINEGYTINGSLGWLLSMVLIVQSSNLLNFLINKNNIVFWITASVVGGLVLLQRFEVFDITIYSQQLFNAMYSTPMLSLIVFIVLISLYYFNYKQLRTKVYLDVAVKEKVKEANTADLSWANRFGEMAPFIKNEIRLIWRNKRTKTVFLMSFLFVLYGLIFFPQEEYQKMPAMLVFASLFVTGGFALNYGQFIPAWESAYYKMLMSQNLSYRKYLESKWFLMSIMTIILFILATPYIYFGLDVYLMIAAGALFNIGFNTMVLLYAGSFNRKQIDLNASGFGNTQGTSAKQFIIIIPVMLFPVGVFYGVYFFLGLNAGLITIATLGIIGLISKSYLMNLITKKYVRDKYAAIHAFNQKA